MGDLCPPNFFYNGEELLGRFLSNQFSSNQLYTSPPPAAEHRGVGCPNCRMGSGRPLSFCTALAGSSCSCTANSVSWGILVTWAHIAFRARIWEQYDSNSSSSSCRGGGMGATWTLKKHDTKNKKKCNANKCK